LGGLFGKPFCKVSIDPGNSSHLFVAQVSYVGGWAALKARSEWTNYSLLPILALVALKLFGWKKNLRYGEIDIQDHGKNETSGFWMIYVSHFTKLE